MSEFMAQMIIDNPEDGKYTYTYVTGKRPDLKTGIDAYLTLTERTDLIIS
jgi:hypothetical protein